MTYTYVAVNEKNKKYKSEITAENKAEVRQLLKDRGLTALIINEKMTAVEANNDKKFWEKDLNVKDIHDQKIEKKKLLTVTHQMALMMRSGISLSMAMEVMIDTEKDKKLREILNLIKKDLYNGVSLSAAMGKFKAFPLIVVNIVQAGEANGRLDLSFEQSTIILEKEIKLTGKIKSAMIYPIILLVLTIGLIILLSVLIIPQFEGLFSNFGADLPGITKFTMAMSDVIMNYWYIIIGVIVLIVLTIKYLLTKDNIAMLWAEKQLSIPIVGTVIKITAVARFCRMMSTLTDAGVSILRSLELSRDVIDNLYIKDCLNQVIEDVKIGTPINVAMARYKIFDSLLISLLRAAEESGQLSDALRKTSDLYEEQADESTKRLMEFMTPATIAIMAVVVGTVVISVVVPMFGVYDVILVGTGANA